MEGGKDWKGRISLGTGRKERGGATSPSGSLGLFGAGGANRGELRDHVPFPLNEGRVDRQLTRNGDISRLELRDNVKNPDFFAAKNPYYRDA